MIEFFIYRSTDWWDTVARNFDDAEWVKHFRVRKSTFERIVLLLKEDLRPGIIALQVLKLSESAKGFVLFQC